MTRKDYKLIANSILKQKTELDLLKNTLGSRILGWAPGIWEAKQDTLYISATNLADALEGDNERFNRDIFLKACGY